MVTEEAANVIVVVSSPDPSRFTEFIAQTIPEKDTVLVTPENCVTLVI
jgi:hypothetical protein